MIEASRLISDSKPSHKPRIVEIEEKRIETPTIATLMFTDERCSRAQPGKFVMIWIPSVDEIPMGLSYVTDKGYCGITVRQVGDATKALHSMNVGDRIGVRGPYGNGFKVAEREKVLIVAGGSGIACVASLIEELGRRANELTIVIGARASSELLFMERIKKTTAKAKTRLLASTDDGSYGSKSLASDLAITVMENSKFDLAYTCGPEPMMKKVAEECFRRDIPVQASLERMMKCGIGICGSCVIGECRVCKDGPVFDGGVLRNLPEFGTVRRDASGMKVKV
jgi:dihydroorotate dehydrogenase electron transfer subunit